MVFLSIPTTAILASNNAVPGDRMYPVKITIEKIASKLSSPSYQAHSDLEIQLIQRRIAENQKLLIANGSTEGLKLLVSQAEAATEYIINSNVKPKTKTQTVQKLINTLEETHQILEQEKQNLAHTHNYQKSTPNPTISQGNTPSEESAGVETQQVEYEDGNTNSQETTEENQKESEKTKEEYEEIEEEIELTQKQIEDMKKKASKAKKESESQITSSDFSSDGDKEKTSYTVIIEEENSTEQVDIDSTTQTASDEDTQVYNASYTTGETLSDSEDTSTQNTDATTDTMTDKEKRLEDLLMGDELTSEDNDTNDSNPYTSDTYDL